MLSYESRREIDINRYPVAVVVLAPLLAIGLQSVLSLHFEQFNLLNLPLLMTIYFAVARRNPVTGTLLGTAVGIGQDALTHLPLGVNGIVNALIGFLAASLSVKLDVENHGTRLLLNFAFLLLHSFCYWIITRHMLATNLTWNWLHELLRAGVNAVLGVLLFALLDRLRRRD
ncbi:MAG TPA: rod shape-determining protein MreD [Acidisarcina sp.]